MQTLPEILSDVPLPTSQRYAQTLTKAGLLSPINQGDGLPFLYSEADAYRLREFSRLRRIERLSVENVLGKLGSSMRINAPQGESMMPIDAHQSASKRIDEPTMIVDLEAARAARSEAEALAIVEQQKREEAERTAAAAVLRAADEEKRRRDSEIAADLERRNMIARIARLEKAMTEKPKGFRARIRAAWDVLTGRRAAPLALPAPRDREEGETFQKAA